MRVVNVESVAHVAEKLQALDEQFAFLGGAVLPLLLDDTSIVIVRPTKDVDVIVEVLTRLEYSKLEETIVDILGTSDQGDDDPGSKA